MTRPTLEACIKPILQDADEEILREMFAVTALGKEYIEEQSEEVRQAKKVLEINKTFKGTSPDKQSLVQGIIKNMEDAFTEGLGFADAFKGMDLYPRQLYETRKVLIKALKEKAKELNDAEWIRKLEEEENRYSNVEETCYYAKEIEESIVTLLVDAYIRTLPEEEKDKLMKNLVEAIRKNADKLSGLELSNVNVAYILTHGGLIALRQLLGFQFHIILAIVINTLWKFTGGLIVGTGLSLAINALIQRIAAVLLGPIGWIFIIISTLPIITKLLNPREYDKYLPGVVYIYLLRHKDTIEDLSNLPE